ncbi:MAG: VOC family protein [Labilithrix sp.]|nr:VOC family protein [Labilithrix sp.]
MNRRAVPKARTFFADLSAPARRALEQEGIDTLTKLAKRREHEILALHGVGASTMPKLRRSLAAAGLAFRAPAKLTKTTTRTSPMLRKIAFTMFSVTDAKRARRFYEELLGLKRGLASPDGTWTEYDLPDGGCLALFRHPNLASAQPGGASVAFEVADLDALSRRLKAAGVAFQGDLVRGPRCRMWNIVDSEGNRIILHQLNDAS